MKTSTILIGISFLALIVLLVCWALVTNGVAVPYVLAPTLFFTQVVFVVPGFILWTKGK